MALCAGGLVLSSWGGEVAGRRMAWAHYVPWYKPENASLAIGDFYNFPWPDMDGRESRLESTRREIADSRASGVDGWFVDLGANPPKGPLNSAGDMMGYLDAAKGSDFQVAICLDGASDPAYLARATLDLLKQIGDHPNYPKMNGRSVVATYAFQNRPRTDWNDFRRLCREGGRDVYLIANMSAMPHAKTDFASLEACRDAIDAVYMFDAPGHAEDPPETTNRELRDWCAAHGKRAMPCLHPGYWGAWLKGANDFYHPFRGFDMLYRMFESGRAAGPVDWIHITSWNDLCETPLMPCVFTPGNTRILRAYCDGMKGLDIAGERAEIFFAYHREELVGTLLRIEAMALPRRGGLDVTVQGVLRDDAGRVVETLPPRRLSGTGFARCEWLVSTTPHAERPCLVPSFTVESEGRRRTAQLPSVFLVTGWLRNAVTVNVPFDRFLDGDSPRVNLSQTGGVFRAEAAFKEAEPVRRLILFRNDRPFLAFTPDADAREIQRVVLLTGIQGDLSVAVTNGRLLRAVKNFERNNNKWGSWKWDAKGLLSRYNPAFGVHGLVFSGAPEMKLVPSRTDTGRLLPSDVDRTALDTPPVNLREGCLAVNREAPPPRETDSYWLLLETASGRFRHTAPSWPFGGARRFETRAILETATSLDTSMNGGGYALRNDPEFLTPVDEIPVRSNRVVVCRVPRCGTRTAEWTFDAPNRGVELPKRTWPVGTMRIRLRLRADGACGTRQTIIHQFGWTDGMTLELNEQGNLEVIRGFENGRKECFERMTGRTKLAPGVMHEVEIEGDMAEVRLHVDGRIDATLHPTPARSLDGCRMTIGGGIGRQPFKGLVERLAISGL